MVAPVIVTRRDPLRNYRFKVFVQGFPGFVLGVQRVSGLTRTVTAFEVWEGGNNLHRYANPDKVNWDPVTLEQGMAVTTGMAVDKANMLELWAESVRQYAMTGKKQLAAVKRNVTIEVPLAEFTTPFRTDPNMVRRYTILNAWISRYNAMPKLDGLTSEVALISVELQHEGWTVAFSEQSTPSQS